jgi:hypothetical protein
MEDDTENKLHGFKKVGGQFSPGTMLRIPEEKQGIYSLGMKRQGNPEML